MIQVKFKNLDRSEIAQEIVFERVENFVKKFKDLEKSRVSVTLEMHNSPLQPGPDFFSAKIYVSSGRFNGISVEKSGSNLYAAFADTIEHMLEKINRFGDKERVKERARARNASRNFL